MKWNAITQKLDSVLYLLIFMRFNLRYHMGCCPDTRWDFKEEECVGRYYILLNWNKWWLPTYAQNINISIYIF